MGKTEEYRQYAKECLRLAAAIGGPQARAALLQMAQVWFRLAQDAEKPSRIQESETSYLG
jgi:hypothetical protein